MKLALVIDRPSQQKNQKSNRSPSVAEGEIVQELNYPCVTASAASKMTPPRATPISNPILFVLIGIIGFILNRILLNMYLLIYENECELENVNVKCKNNFGELLLCGLCCTPHPTPSAHIMEFNFIDSRSGVRDQLILKDVYDIVYGEYDLDCDLNIFCEGGFNENFYNNGYYYPTTEPHGMLFCRYYPCTFYFVFCVLQLQLLVYVF